jgi:hypothetical protein
MGAMKGRDRDQSWSGAANLAKALIEISFVLFND